MALFSARPAGRSASEPLTVAITLMLPVLFVLIALVVLTSWDAEDKLGGK